MKGDRTKQGYVGKRFGLYVVIGYDADKSVPKHAYWKCKCDCGNEFSIRQDGFKTQRSCGCIRANSLVIGQTFGRLTVLEVAHERKTHNQGICYKCQCACGNIHFVHLTHLHNGGVKSCGCLLKESKTLFQPTHGMTKTRQFSIWQGMKNRCFNKNDDEHRLYGARGITVCEEWKNDFVSFYEWAMVNGYSKYLTLDRINNNGNYEPENCKWSTPLQQSNNSRLNITVTVNNKYFTSLASVAREYGLSATLITKYHKTGNLEELINKKLMAKGKKE